MWSLGLLKEAKSKVLLWSRTERLSLLWDQTASHIYVHKYVLSVLLSARPASEAHSSQKRETVAWEFGWMVLHLEIIRINEMTWLATIFLDSSYPIDIWYLYWAKCGFEVRYKMRLVSEWSYSTIVCFYLPSGLLLQICFIVLQNSTGGSKYCSFSKLTRLIFLKCAFVTFIFVLYFARVSR